MASTEKITQKSILEYIKSRGGVAVKINNGGIRKPDGKFIPPRQKGVSDILACYKGKFIAIEVKDIGKKPSDNQVAFLDQVINAEGLAICADNLAVVEDLLNEIDIVDKMSH